MPTKPSSLKQANYVRATTRRGHTEARQENVRLSVKLELGVLFAHVDQVIHDLTHHETLIDVSRLLGDHHVQAAILETKGDQVYAQFKTALKDIAIGSAGGRTILDAAASWMRTGTQISMMGWNLWTALQQPLGLFNGMERVGVRSGSRAAWRAGCATRRRCSRPRQWIYAVSPAWRAGTRRRRRTSRSSGRTLTKPGGWFDLAVRRVTLDTSRSRTFSIRSSGTSARRRRSPTFRRGSAPTRRPWRTGTTSGARSRSPTRPSSIRRAAGRLRTCRSRARRADCPRSCSWRSTATGTPSSTGPTRISTVSVGHRSVGELLGGLSLLYVFPAIGTVALAHASARVMTTTG
jgi:hypothetical protein